MIVEIISTQIIKPSSPTPDHLKNFTLSAFDQLTPAMYVPLILFYTNTGEISIQEASDRLKKSLAITLTPFFPFAAGKIRNNTSVDCNDEGVNYREARINCNLRDILEPAPDMEVLGRLLPTVSGYADSSGVLLVQQSVFECGGMAIGFCFPHKVADMDTISSFLKSWAGACACSGDVVAAAAAPDFTLGSLFPPLDIFAWSSSPGDLAGHSATDKCTYRRFVLSASQASSLQSKSRSPTVSNPTRVEAVTSLIWQRAMKASSVVHSNINPSSTLLQTVNLRKRIDPPLPDVSFGNFVGFYITRADNATDLPSLATKMRDAKEEYLQGYPRKLRSEGLGLIFDMVQQGSEFGKDGSTMYWVTSWCRFGLYEVDFGWGKPIWAGTYKNQLGNSVVVMDGRDGEGMEAWLTFPEEVMVVLENDEEFLAFAAMNPKVIVTE